MLQLFLLSRKSSRKHFMKAEYKHALIYISRQSVDVVATRE